MPGKGGGCCSATLVTVITVVSVALVGLGLLGAGVTTLVVNTVSRSNQITSVESAAEKWTDSTSASSWQKFQKLTAYVSLTAPYPATPLCQAAAQTIKLLPEACQRDVYLDEAERFQSITQLAFCAGVEYDVLVNCDLQVEFLVAQPEAASNSSLAKLPDLVGLSPGQVDIAMDSVEGVNHCGGRRRCYGGDWARCTEKCKDGFGGSLKCPGWICHANTYNSDLAVKVSYVPGSPGTFQLDSSNPSLGSGGFGANVLPKGFTYVTPNPQTGRGPRWQYEKPAFLQRPVLTTLTVRSSADPWVAYLAATGGTLYFGSPKEAYFGLSIALMSIGGAVLLAVILFLVFLYYGRSLFKLSPTKRPDGCFKGMAWRLAHELAGAPNTTVAPAQQQMLVMAQTAPYAAPNMPPSAGSYPYPPPPPGGGYPPQPGAYYPQQQQQVVQGVPYIPYGAGPQYTDPYGARPQ